MLVNTSMGDAGGYKANDMWGPVERPGVEAQRPDGQHGTLVANNTRIWVYCGDGKPSDSTRARRQQPVNAKFLEGFTLRTNKTFQDELPRRRRQERRVQLPGERHAQLGLLGLSSCSR